MSLLARLFGSTSYRNREGHARFDFRLPATSVHPGVSAMVRARNEASKIGACLQSILPLFDEIIVVDNGSEDGTADLVRALQRDEPRGNRIVLRQYPFRLARFGPEHRQVAADSIHSAVYFSNWALAQCSRRFVCKWDADMVAVRETRAEFGAFLEAVQRGYPKGWSLAGQTIYRDANGDYLLAIGEVNREVELVPAGRGCRFVKKPHWEHLARPPWVRRGDFIPVAFYELKFVLESEFGHWSTTEWPSPRKRREWHNFESIRNGTVDQDRFRLLDRTFLDDQCR